MCIISMVFVGWPSPGYSDTESVTVVDPNGVDGLGNPQILSPGQRYRLVWKQTGYPQTFSLYLLDANHNGSQVEGPYGSIAYNLRSTSESHQYYDWTIPSYVPTGYYYLQAQAHFASGNWRYDESDIAFKIQAPFIRVVRPVAGTSYNSGQLIGVSWESAGIDASGFNISLVYPDKHLQNLGIAGTTQRSISVTLPSSLATSSNYRISVSGRRPDGGTVSNASGYFTIKGTALPNYTLSVAKSGTGSGTITSAPSGINCGTTCSKSFASGTSVALTASAASGSTFGSWSGCTSVSGTTCTVSMTANKSVTGIFNVSTAPPSPPVLTAPSNGTVLSTTQTTVTLSWNAALGATSYQVRAMDTTNSSLRLPDNNCGANLYYLCRKGLANRSYSLPVEAGHGYTWWLYACNTSGCSNPSTARSFSIQSSGYQLRLKGGSNYNWYDLGPCDFWTYGVIAQYDVQTTTINNQLMQMFNNGQRRLRIGIYFMHGSNGSTQMDSTGGNLAPRYRTNLANLLASIKAKGYQEIIVAFHPIGINHYDNWGDPKTLTSWREDIYQENWNLIVNLRPIIVAAGIPYRIDLMNEASPPEGYPIHIQYAQRMWADYTRTFGKTDTLGFSIIPLADRISQLPVVYGSNYPDVFDFHFYGDLLGRSVKDSFIIWHNGMIRLGLSQPWIIGEAFYNDTTNGREIQEAIATTGRNVLFLTQWPLTRNGTCGSGADVAYPASFTEYITDGF